MKKGFFGGIVIGFLVGTIVTICIYPTKSEPTIPVNLKLCFEYYKWAEQTHRETTDMERYCSQVRRLYSK